MNKFLYVHWCGWSRTCYGYKVNVWFLGRFYQWPRS